MTNLLEVTDLSVTFKIKDKSSLWPRSLLLKAVKDISFKLKRGEVLGVVGESGCGKSTLAKSIINLVRPTGGSIIYDGEDITQMSKEKRIKIAKEVQMIFQDPLASLNPRMTLSNIIGEPLRVHYPEMKKEEIDREVELMMSKVGLLPNMKNRYPHEFSGGQAQRIGIARALILKPKLLICDEPVSALDVSIQAQVINLLSDLRKDLNLSIIFIAHDLSVVKHISDRVMVMYLGTLFELGTDHEVFDKTLHPYTKALMSAVSVPDPDLEANKVIDLLEGDLPSPINPPSGCVFRNRCSRSTPACADQVPQLRDFGEGHLVSCINI